MQDIKLVRTARPNNPPETDPPITLASADIVGIEDEALTGVGGVSDDVPVVDTVAEDVPLVAETAVGLPAAVDSVASKRDALERQF
jgi:hypothetical protein